MRTLYVTGWCVSARGKNIFATRARVRRRKFLGNYGIERKDVGATLGKTPAERIGFAIAVPLPRGKSQVTIEVQEWDGVWRPISSRAVFGTLIGDSQAPIDPKYFIHNPDANPRIEFWLDRPLVWPKKTRHLRVSGWCLAVSGNEITELRARVRKNIFPARFFMGDVGSFALGTALGIIALQTDTIYLLPIIGAVYAAETGSVIINRVSKKLRHGKKVFLSSPIHHHFEAIGWPETKVTMRFWIIGQVVGVIGLAIFVLGRR